MNQKRVKPAALTQGSPSSQSQLKKNLVNIPMGRLSGDNHHLCQHHPQCLGKCGLEHELLIALNHHEIDEVTPGLSLYIYLSIYLHQGRKAEGEQVAQPN